MKMKVTSFLTALVALGLSSAANAAIITYYGADNGAVPGGARPNSDAAVAAFNAAVSTTVIDFESGTLTNPVAGVTLGLAGQAGGGLKSADEHSPTPLGFNTTASGRSWLQIWPAFDSPTGATATFTFANPINAFGAFFTDTQDGFPGTITIGFDDGTSQSLSFTKNDSNSGGVLFFGFTDFGKSFNSVAINTGATGGTRDIWGIDDVKFGTVPEPGTLALLGLGLAGFAATRRRKQ